MVRINISALSISYLDVSSRHLTCDSMIPYEAAFCSIMLSWSCGMKSLNGHVKTWQVITKGWNGILGPLRGLCLTFTMQSKARYKKEMYISLVNQPVFLTRYSLTSWQWRQEEAARQSYCFACITLFRRWIWQLIIDSSYRGILVWSHENLLKRFYYLCFFN